jgi:hypothetical protein
MFKGAYDVFALVINFLNSDWEPKHVTISLFEAIETSRQAFQKFDKIVGQVWFKEKISLIMSKMKDLIPTQWLVHWSLL